MYGDEGCAVTAVAGEVAYVDPAGCVATAGAGDGDAYGDPADRVLAGWVEPVVDDAYGTSAEIAVKVGSLGDGEGAGTIDVPVIISLAIRAIAVTSCVASSGSVGAPIGCTPPAVMPGLAGVIDGDGLADIGMIEDGTGASAGIAVTAGSLAPPPAGVGGTSAGDIPGDGGIVDPAAIAPCCGDSGTGDSDWVPNSSPAIRAIAIIICVWSSGSVGSAIGFTPVDARPGLELAIDVAGTFGTAPPASWT